MKNLIPYTAVMKKQIAERVTRVMNSDPRFRDIKLGVEVEEESQAVNLVVVGRKKVG